MRRLVGRSASTSCLLAAMLCVKRPDEGKMRCVRRLVDSLGAGPIPVGSCLESGVRAVIVCVKRPDEGTMR